MPTLSEAVESYMYTDEIASLARSTKVRTRIVLDDLIKVTGSNLGGHSVLCFGVNHNEKYFKIQNSWGPAWGINGGLCRISFDDMDRLLHEDGEACIPTARKRVIL